MQLRKGSRKSSIDVEYNENDAANETKSIGNLEVDEEVRTDDEEDEDEDEDHNDNETNEDIVVDDDDDGEVYDETTAAATAAAANAAAKSIRPRPNHEREYNKKSSSSHSSPISSALSMIPSPSSTQQLAPKHLLPNANAVLVDQPATPNIKRSVNKIRRQRQRVSPASSMTKNLDAQNSSSILINGKRYYRKFEFLINGFIKNEFLLPFRLC